MNIRLYEIISDVKDFGFIQKTFYHISSNKIKLAGAKKDLKLEGAKHSGSMHVIEEFILWSDGRGKLILFDSIREEINFKNNCDNIKYTMMPILINRSIPLIQRNSDGKRMFFYNTDEKKIYKRLFDFRQYFQKKSGNHIFLYWSNMGNDENLYRKDINNNVLWCYEIDGTYKDISGFDKQVSLLKFFGIYNDVLWCLVDGRGIIALDPDTGDELHRLQYESNLTLDQNSGMLVGLQNDSYYSVDLSSNNPKLEEYKFSENAESYGIRANFDEQRFCYDENYFYFCDSIEGKIGLFDRKTKSIVWSHKLDIENEGIAQITDMKINDNKWYVLDRHNTLHIFERT